MKKAAAILCSVLVVSSIVLTEAPRAATAGDGKQKAKINVHEDVVYGRVHGAGLLCDVAYPAGKGPFPVILSVHGGRWFRESKTTHSAIKVRQWAEFGYVAVSIDYRLLGCAPAPACYQDVLCAIRWLHANPQKYPIDKERIFLIGQSAGGHMVALAATLGDGPFPKTGGWDDQPHEFRGVICVAAPYELNKLDWGNGWTPPGEDPVAARKLASPIHHVAGKMRPILMLHSDDDKSVPIQQALDMAAVLKKAKVRHRFEHYKDKGHISMTEDVIRETRRFMDEIGGLAQ